jgi:hypothetical protein
MVSISQITAGDAKSVSEESTLNDSCEQSSVLSLGDNAKEIGGVLNVQGGLTNSPETNEELFEELRQRGYYVMPFGVTSEMEYLIVSTAPPPLLATTPA